VDSLRVAVLAALNLADELALNASADPARARPRRQSARSSMKCSTSNEKRILIRKTGS